MSNTLSKAYVLSLLQLYILLSKIGIQQLLAFECPGDMEQLTQGEVNVAINKMITSGVLEPEEDRLVINHDVRTILEQIQTTDRFIRIINNMKQKEYIGYVNLSTQSVSVISHSRVRNQKVVISYVSMDDFLEDIAEEIGPQESEVEEVSLTEKELFFEREILEFYKLGFTEQEVTLTVSQLDRNGNTEKQLYVIQNGEKKYILCQDSEPVRYTIPASEDLKQRLCQWMMK